MTRASPSPHQSRPGRLCIAPALALLVSACGEAGPAAGTELAVEAHYAPTENLERVDLGAIGQARRTIDMAAYVLSDFAIIDALVAAQARSVAVRIVLDQGQHHAWDKLGPLMPSIKVKPSRVYMHLKSYAVDGALLRAGAANFSASGLKRQNNDLLLVRDAPALRAFEAAFEHLWAEGVPASTADRAVRATDEGE